MDLDERFAKGGEAELEELIKQYSNKLTRYATTILFNHQDAEDVVQETFFSAYKNRHRFDGWNLSAWLHKITYNLCLNKRRKRKLLFFSDINETPSYTIDFNVDDFTVEAMSKLKPHERALLHMRIMDELSYDEISEIVGRSPAALRKQYERAKKKVAEYLIEREFKNANS